MQAPEALIIIAGKGAYPLLLADSARRQGVGRIVALAFRGETDTAIEKRADEVSWLRLGRLQELLDAARAARVGHAVMAGQVTPTALFHVRLDALALKTLAGLKLRNAETIFGAVGDLLREAGIELLPAHLFMESHMPGPGLLTKKAPSDRQQADIALGFKVAKTTSGLDIGQTVAVKDGTILAIEAFDGTDATIRRAGELCGGGAVIVKTAKRGHDMRFDIPVVGMHTLKLLKQTRAAALAVEAGRTILLEREKLLDEADRQGICLVAIGDGKET